MNPVLGYLIGWELPALICLIVGIILLIVEMFTPGLGASGALGIAALIAAVILRADTLANALITLAIVLVIIGIAAFVFFRSFSKGKLSRSRIILQDSIHGESNELHQSSMQAYIGKVGTAVTTLRPAGKANFDGTKLDVVTGGEYIEQGSRVKVVDVEGLRIVVEEEK